MVIGPVGRLETAFELVESEGQIDSAILDVNVGDDDVFPIAEALADRNVHLFSPPASRRRRFLRSSAAFQSATSQSRCVG
ncbi:hypothetical protein QO004_003782 [Rhizobium mesoamericanum]|nr:hypothetical protein [Rhizobium mesoamericanum]